MAVLSAFVVVSGGSTTTGATATERPLPRSTVWGVTVSYPPEPTVGPAEIRASGPAEIRTADLVDSAEIRTVAPAGPAEIRGLVCALPWDCAKAIRVAECESSLNPRAESAGNYGVFQIGYSSHRDLVPGPAESLYEPAFNVEVAFQIYAKSGWAPWPVCGKR